MGIDSRNLNAINQFLVRSPFGQKLGVEIVSLEPDSIKLKLPFLPDNVTLNQVVHGGAIATLVDIAGAIAAVSNKNPEAPVGGATKVLTIRYKAPAQGVDIIAFANVRKRTESKVISKVLVYGPEEALIAKAKVVTILPNDGNNAMKPFTVKS